MPLDLPLFKHKEAVIKSFDQLNKTKFIWWNEISLTDRDYSIPFEAAIEWNTVATDNFKPLVDYIDEHFPFEHKVFVALYRANRDVAPHIDNNYTTIEENGGSRFNLITPAHLQHQRETEPCGYRILINGNRRNLYLADDNFQGKDYCEIPESTDCFVLKTNDSPHGVDKIQDDDNRLLLFMIGKLDKQAHARLLERSYEKYSAYSKS